MFVCNLVYMHSIGVENIYKFLRIAFSSLSLVRCCVTFAWPDVSFLNFILFCCFFCRVYVFELSFHVSQCLSIIHALIFHLVWCFFCSWVTLQYPFLLMFCKVCNHFLQSPKVLIRTCLMVHRTSILDEEIENIMSETHFIVFFLQ